VGGFHVKLFAMGTAKDKQVSFKVDQPLYDRIEAAASAEDLPSADFVRKLFVWSLEQYDAAGSVRTLRLMALPEELIESTLQEEREILRQRRARLKQKKYR